MSKNTPKQQVQAQKVSPTPKQATDAAKGSAGFSIPYPVLLLVVAVIVAYFPSFSFGFTELDDTIFIKEFRAYNEDTHNLITAFTRGLFDTVKDPYYRPLFSDAMILNYQFSGDSPAGYHFVNVLLHIASVLLLYRLLGKLGIRSLHCFLLSLIFAVHPVLSQAVAWIPGRNDTLLAVFVLLFFSAAVDYTDKGKPMQLVLSGIYLMLAYFTKETAVFAAPAAFMLLVWYKGSSWKSKQLVHQYIVWVVCFGIWYMARNMATIQSSGIGSAAAMTDLLHRLPVTIQYIGKVILPFNLSVFPTQQDTVIYFGLAAIALLVVAVIMYKPTRTPVFGALGIFLLFLMPALLVPEKLNQQTFEHRLYLPMIGIILLLPQTVIFNNKLGARQLSLYIIGVCAVFVVLNNRHQQHFDNPLAFWTQAAGTSPNSAYANMMLAARLDKAEGARSEELFRKAYRLNPQEKYLNFYMGELMLKKDSVLAAEPYLLIEKKISDYVQCDFYLARVAMTKGDKQGAINYLASYLKRDQHNPMANNNLLLLYMDTQQLEKAKTQALQMKQIGLDIPPTIMQQLGIR